VTAKILVVDDEEDIRDICTTLLQREGHVVLTASDYASTLAIAQEEVFDVMLIDIMLGGETGITLLRELKQRGLLCPIIMITGNPSVENAAESLRLGAFDYMQKPLRKEEMLHTVRLALQQKRLLDDREQLEAEKEQYRENLEAVFSSVQAGIISIDHNYTVLNANSAIEHFFSVAPEKILNQKIHAIVNEKQNVCLSVLEKTLQEKEVIRDYRVEWTNAAGTPQVVMLSCTPLLGRKKDFRGATLVIRDITRLSTLEQTLRERQQFQKLIGKNPKMQRLYELLENVSTTETTVLILGESGTGKELVAEAIHYSGRRALQPLIKVNCTALAENLLESELFGHVRGAFTGALKDKIGRFQAADGGTILLDEIGDISPALQLKLLRVLQYMEFERVGDSATVKVDVRVIAATNQNLKKKITEGRFREDLYYRLKVVEVALPPLRERTDDIPLLVAHFIKRFNDRFKKNIESVSDEVMEIFMRYAWPGNVRELEHVIEHAFVLCHTETIMPDNLPADLHKQSLSPNVACQPGGKPALDRVVIIDALTKAGWNKSKAARLLGVNRLTIYRKIQELNIEDPKL